MKRLIAIAAMALALAGKSAAAEGDFTVTLLGTGTPPPLMNRFGPATLVEAGGKMFLFDAGRGATQRMWQLKKPFGQLDALILTHLHTHHRLQGPMSRR